jgi:hypothetical protein
VLVTIVHASGCASLLLYVLLYGLDTYASRRRAQTPPATPLCWRWTLVSGSAPGCRLAQEQADGEACAACPRLRDGEAA